MPRKAGYGLHYDDFDIDDEYEDYEYYDYDHDIEGNGKLSLTDKVVSESGLWQCFTCEYDNDGNSYHCDTCGSLRDPSNNHNFDNGNTNGALLPKESVTFGNYLEQKGTLSQPEKVGSMSEPWQCSTCEYDNDYTSLHCDTCGALRDPSYKYNNSNSSSTGAIFRKEAPTFGNYLEQKASIKAPSCSNGRKGMVKVLPDKGISESSSVLFSNGNRHNENKISTGRNNEDKSQLLVRDLEKLKLHKSCMKSREANLHAQYKPEKHISLGLPDKGMSESSSSIVSNGSRHNEKKISTWRNIEEKSQILVRDPDKLKLHESSTKSREANSHAQYKPEKHISLGEEELIRSQLNLAIVGHVDSGKSTLSGRLLHLLGRISKKEMHKFEKESKEKGKKSFAYAWAMDESAEERERGVTMTVAVAYFMSKKYRVVLLDSPGHRDFVPNMISGAIQADAAVLVVDASIGSFEAGMNGNGVGQTKEHSQLIRSFGVEQIIVAVNKMDEVQYSKERFDLIKLQLGSFLHSCGFKETSVAWIPLSAIENQNLATTASDIRLSCWYQGSCLLDAIDSLQPLPRDISKPLRLPICDVIRSHLGQVAASGKLESGSIQNGSKVLFMPSRELATIRSIERDSRACTTATAGDNVAVGLHGVDCDNVRPGWVLCHPDFPVDVASLLELKILVLDTTTPILVGSQVEFQIHHAKAAATIAKIVSLIDPKSGKASVKPPRLLKSKQSGVVEVAIEGAVCVEEFSKCRALGRAFLRSSGSTIAVGVVTRILER